MDTFRKMRRARQVLSDAETEEILKNGTDGVLSVLGDNGYPYGIPLNYIYLDGKIYFHCAKRGHKIDAIRACDRVSFCVIGKNKVLPEWYATEYTSAVVFGRARLMTDPTEMRRIVQLLALKYCPGDEAGVAAETDREFAALAMLELTPEYMSGKKSSNLV